MAEDLESLFSLAGRTALVTGGTSGIGAMIARGLLIAGAEVFIVGRQQLRCEEAAKSLSRFGQCRGVGCDLGEPNGIASLVEEMSRRAPKVSILFNNAGMAVQAKLGTFTLEHWSSILSLNLTVPFMLAQGLLPLLRENASISRPSHIVNTGSVGGLIANVRTSYSYAASKAALHHITRALALELASEHICVNAIAPGLFPSEMSRDIVSNATMLKEYLPKIPAHRLGDEQDMGILAVSIVANAYLTGAVIPLDGGLAL